MRRQTFFVGTVATIALFALALGAWLQVSIALHPVPISTLHGAALLPRFHSSLQPMHYLIRLTHIVSAAAFFGAIGLLDLRLIGVRASVQLRPIAELALPWLHATFGVALVSGVMLFLYDPALVSGRTYFVPKMLLMMLGLANAALYHRIGHAAALSAGNRMPMAARISGTLSLAFWIGVVACACLNGEAP
jgi:hypothetical protein